MSLEPQLGKLVLVGLALRCLDPILTIASVAGNKDPFLMPMQPELQVSTSHPWSSGLILAGGGVAGTRAVHWSDAQRPHDAGQCLQPVGAGARKGRPRARLHSH